MCALRRLGGLFASIPEAIVFSGFRLCLRVSDGVGADFRWCIRLCLGWKDGAGDKTKTHNLTTISQQSHNNLTTISQQSHNNLTTISQQSHTISQQSHNNLTTISHNLSNASQQSHNYLTKQFHYFLKKLQFCPLFIHVYSTKFPLYFH